jgi:hypothetical protein
MTSKGLYEEWLLPYIPEHGDTAIDVGAHLGIWTKLLAGRFNLVYSIEPNPEVIEELRKSLPSNARLHSVAAWDSAALLKFSRYEHSGHLSAYFEGEGIGTGPPKDRIEQQSYGKKNCSKFFSVRRGGESCPGHRWRNPNLFLWRFVDEPHFQLTLDLSISQLHERKTAGLDVVTGKSIA